MINKIIGFLVFLSFILNMIFTVIPANCISGNIDTINNDKEADYGLYHVDIGLSSGVNPSVMSSRGSHDRVIKNCSVLPCKVYGLTFGPHTKEGQDPNKGITVGEEQIRELLAIIAPYTEWIVTYGCVKEMENISYIPHELGFKIAGGAWLTDNLTNNAKQISSLINISQAGDADMLIVGGEVLYRNDLTENQLIEYINEVKIACPGIPVATTDVYYEFLKHPKVISAVDVVMATYYPYWAGAKIEYGVYLLHLWHQELVEVADGKPVIVAETGWPSGGQQVGGAVPSPENASFYFLNIVSWAIAENVSYFYFEAFDEPWKAHYADGPAGAHWGVWDKDGILKPDMERVFNCETIPNNWEIGVIDGPGDSVIEFTYIPRLGNLFDELKGRVSHVKPGDCRVAVYTKVGGEWWTKPSLDNSRIIIWPDGNWSCMITPGKAGALATKIVAYLLPYNYYPPIMSGESDLPLELDENALAKVMITRPKYKPYLNTPFLQFLENHPHIFPLLRQLLGL